MTRYWNFRVRTYPSVLLQLSKQLTLGCDSYRALTTTWSSYSRQPLRTRTRTRPPRLTNFTLPTSCPRPRSLPTSILVDQALVLPLLLLPTSSAHIVSTTSSHVSSCPRHLCVVFPHLDIVSHISHIVSSRRLPHVFPTTPAFLCPRRSPRFRSPTRPRCCPCGPPAPSHTVSPTSLLSDA
jgi:hypothetical protein